MKIFITNLPSGTQEPDLRELLKPFYKAGGLRLQILSHAHEQGGHDIHAIVDITHERLAAKALKKLNGQSFQGRQLRLREFQHRSYSNERRALGWRNRPWKAKERRLGERRRQVRIEPGQFDEVFGINTTSGIRVHEIHVTSADEVSRGK